MCSEITKKAVIQGSLLTCIVKRVQPFLGKVHTLVRPLLTGVPDNNRAIFDCRRGVLDRSLGPFGTLCVYIYHSRLGRSRFG